MSCDHGEDKGFTYLDCFEARDVYICECGKIIDLWDSANQSTVAKVIDTPEAFAELLEHERNLWIDTLRYAVENAINNLNTASGQEEHSK